MSDGITLETLAVAARFRVVADHVAQGVYRDGDTAVHDQMVNVRQRIIQTSPVDTGNLRAHWSPVLKRRDLVYGISNDRVYAPVLEYGGYRRLGPRTLRAGPAMLDDSGEFEAPEGIYSTQAPLGWTRKALIEAKPQYLLRINNVVRRQWEK